MNFIELCKYSPWEYSKEVGITAAVYGLPLFVIYLYEIQKKYGWLKSISISFYKVRELFQFFMYAEALSITLIAQDALHFIASIFFVIMTWFPSVQYKRFIIPHCICAFTAIILLSIGMPLCYDMKFGIIMCLFEIVIIGILCYEAYHEKNKFIAQTLVYWIEVATLSTICINLVLERLIL